jgi:hypothetical protein
MRLCGEIVSPRRRPETLAGLFFGGLLDYDASADLARLALVAAAMRRSFLTDGDLGGPLDLDPKLAPAHYLNGVLEIVTAAVRRSIGAVALIAARIGSA